MSLISWLAKANPSMTGRFPEPRKPFLPSPNQPRLFRHAVWSVQPQIRRLNSWRNPHSVANAVDTANSDELHINIAKICQQQRVFDRCLDSHMNQAKNSLWCNNDNIRLYIIILGLHYSKKSREAAIAGTGWECCIKE